MNTNSPDFKKHAKAALASKAEMDQWRNIEIIDAIAAVLSLAIAWFASSWIIAIAGIAICGGVGAYASSRKEKATQDMLDHINRADGMSESLVQATRGRREAENALAGAIKRLDEASSKLRSASTYDEKNKAEAEVVSAQAAIESAKLRLQQATNREASESQRNQQQAQPSVDQTNHQSSEEPLDIGFRGDKKLANDGYKIYLVKKHKIEKNDALGKFLCGDRLFESVDEALAFADSLEGPASVAISIPAVPEIPELISGMSELRSNPGPNGVIAGSDQEYGLISSKNKNKKMLLGTGALKTIALSFILICVVGYWAWTRHLDLTSYVKVREQVLKAGWLPLKRRNAIQMDPTYPEIQHCYEGVCTAEFTNAVFPRSVRRINYYVCGAGYEEGYECVGKPRKFLLVNSDKIVEKSVADKAFASFRKQFIDLEQKKETDVERQAQDQKKWVEEMERRDEVQELEEERSAGRASTIPGAQKALRD